MRIAVSLSLLAWVFWRSHPADILDNLRHPSFVPLVIALALFQVGVCVRTLRWSLLLRAHGQSYSFGRVLSLNYSAMFFNTFLPTGFGGDVVRALEVSQGQPGGKGKAVGIVVLDRFLGFAALFVICLAALPFGFGLLPFRTAFGLLAIAAVGLLVSLIVLEGRLLRRLEPWLERIPYGVQLSQASQAVTHLGRRWLLAAWLISLVYNGLIVTVHYWVGQAYHVQVGFQFFALFTPIVSMALLVPSVQGLGVREGIYSYLLAEVGVAAPVAVLVALTVYAITFVSGLVGGVVYLILALEGFIARQSRPVPARSTPGIEHDKVRRT